MQKKLNVNAAFVIIDKKWKPSMVCIPVIPTLKTLRREDHKFKASLGYRARPCLKKKKKVENNLNTLQVMKDKQDIYSGDDILFIY
jgi:hypothetical protein